MIQRTKITSWILMGTAMNITHKTLCALVIGLYGFQVRRSTQLNPTPLNPKPWT